MATLPTTRTWVAGNPLTGAQMNSDVRDLGNFVVSGKPLFVLRNDAGFAATTTVSDITWDVEVLDRDGMHASSNGYVTAVTAGYYLFVLGTVPIPTASVSISLWPKVNGSSINQTYRGAANTNTVVSGYLHTPPLTIVQYLAVGDTFSFAVNVGTNATIPSSGTLATPRPMFSGYWLSQ